MLDIAGCNWHALDVSTAITKLVTNLEQGLSQEEVIKRQKFYPANKIRTARQENMVMRFLRQFHNTLIYILLVAALIEFYLAQWVEASVVFGVILINAIFGVIQEGKAAQALRAIQSMLTPNSLVIRAGKRVTIPSSSLVLGDIVVIKRGDKVPGDLRVCEAKNLQLQEAALTGESLPVEKSTTPVAKDAIMSERSTMLYSGTVVTDGYGLGVVVATGMDTVMGKISKDLLEAQGTVTPLLKQMNIFGHWLTVIILGLACLVFLVGMLIWHNAMRDLFMAVVGLIVAAVPEGLPPSITSILAIGVTKMAKQQAIVRSLPAVETMGAVTTICTDKTGTLTKNELTIQNIVTATNSYILQDKQELQTCDELKTAMTGAILCNDAQIYKRGAEGHSYDASGNPIDVAFVLLGTYCAIDLALCRKQNPRTDFIPYETEHKFMATLHHDHEGGGYIYLKGAPEIVLAKCAWQQQGTKVVPLAKEYWQGNIEKLAALGQRVIAIAMRNTDVKQQTLSFEDVEQELVLVAIFGLLDPPRPEAGLAVAECQKAGINVKMITGDHGATAAAIAHEIGIKGKDVLTGEMLDAMDEATLDVLAQKVNIYARTTPQHKLRLVKALQKNGEVVAMTGDGINDAPALKQADIGIAMGKKGADLAKEAATMVLADDNFATIEHAVREGRTIFNNLQKAIIFILPTSFAQAFAIVVAILLGLTLPITAVQILWVNMITAITLSLALGFEPAEADVMLFPPRAPDTPLLSRYLLWRVFSVSAIFVIIAFGLFLFDYRQHLDLEVARTVVVNGLVFGEAVYLINCRSFTASSFKWRTFFGSKAVLISIGVVTLFQLLFTYVPWMQKLFATQALNLKQWCYIILGISIIFVIIEFEKFLVRAVNLQKTSKLAV